MRNRKWRKSQGQEIILPFFINVHTFHKLFINVLICLKINNQTSQLSRVHKPEGEAPMSCDDRCAQQKTPLLSWQRCIQWKVLDFVWLLKIYVFTVQNLKIKVEINNYLWGFDECSRKVGCFTTLGKGRYPDKEACHTNVLLISVFFPPELTYCIKAPFCSRKLKLRLY